MAVLVAVRLSISHLGFNFPDPLVQTSLDLLDSRTLAQMSSLVEVLEIGLQFQQEFLGKSMAHDGLILYIEPLKCKITEFWKKGYVHIAARALPPLGITFSRLQPQRTAPGPERQR